MSGTNNINLVGSAGEVLKTNVKDLLATGLFSDLTIVCGEKDFKVHKAVLYTQSDYFKKLLSGPFKESKATTIPLDEDPATFKALVHFLYNFTWLPGMSDPSQIVAVYQLADKYFIPPLAFLAASRFKIACDPKGKTEAFVDAIDAVLESTAPNDNTLWDIVFPMVKKNMRLLTSSANFADLLQKHPDLNLRLLNEMSLSSDETTPAYVQLDQTQPDDDGSGYGGYTGGFFGSGGRTLG